MTIGGAVVQERSRWLPAALWVLVLLVGVLVWGLLAGPGPLWGGVRVREHVPNAVLVGLPSLGSLMALLIFHDKALFTRIALACGIGVVGAAAAPFVD